jgi:hypothetical protein
LGIGTRAALDFQNSGSDHYQAKGAGSEHLIRNFGRLLLVHVKDKLVQGEAECNQ